MSGRAEIPRWGLRNALGRLRCWWRGQHDFAVVAVQQREAEYLGRLACRECGREPEPDV